MHYFFCKQKLDCQITYLLWILILFLATSFVDKYVSYKHYSQSWLYTFLEKAYGCNHGHIRQIRLLVNPLSSLNEIIKTNLIIAAKERRHSYQ
jgi:hypothetical protein